jgi:hypothetical protein
MTPRSAVSPARISGGGVILAGAKPAAPPVNPSNGTISGAMAELVEAAALGKAPRTASGFIQTASSERLSAGSGRASRGVGPKIPTAAPPYGPTGRIGRLRYFAPHRIQAKGRLDNRLVFALRLDAFNPLLTLSR